jgi:hypothetical protein
MVLDMTNAATLPAAQTETLYFARYGETSHARETLAYEAPASLDAIKARCVARNTNADVVDPVGRRAGEVHWNGTFKPARSPYARDAR